MSTRDLDVAALQDRAGSSANVAGTCEHNDTNGTQAGSLGVLRRDLLDMRNRHGADTPIGHRCTNLMEMLKAYGGTQDERRRADLEKNMRRQMADLVGLQGERQ